MQKEQGKYIHDYCAGAKSEETGVSAIDLATQGQLEFDRNLLPPREGSLFVEAHESEDGITWYRDRNLGGANVDLHSTSLGVRKEELDKQTITPSTIQMQSRAVLRTEDGRNFAGYTESELIYWRGGWDDRLQQDVKAVHIPSRVSPIFETVSIDRYVLDRIGDCTYGHVIFNHAGREITERLGVRLENRDPVFLAFTPEHVLATTYGSTVLGEFSYEQVKEAGLSASFEDMPEAATLSLAAGQMSIKLRLGKTLKPNYPELMFSEQEEWITDSGILVGKIPLEALN